MLVDEAYYHFFGQTVMDLIGKVPNLMVARTFSKAYGLAGLRLGLLAGPVALMDWVRRVMSPYSVNSIALACLPAAMEDVDYTDWYVSEVKSARAEFVTHIEQIGLKHWPTQANFVLLRIGEKHREFVRAMLKHDVLVRDLRRPRLRWPGAHYHWHTRADEARGSCAQPGTRRNRFGKGDCLMASKAGRRAEVVRNTTETQIELKLTIEGKGRYKVSTGIRFFDHMLELFTRHGAFDLQLTCKGDLDVDQHHTVEDVGIALGEAFDKALGDKKGILRAGYFVMPMDETLAIAAIDLSGRVACVVDDKVKTRLVGDLQSELVFDFFEGFARGARANVHLKTMYGRSNHHKIEALFKAFARALRVACSRDKQLGEMLPSTKGLL